MPGAAPRGPDARRQRDPERRFGAVLAARRDELGLSRRQLAERSGLSYPFVAELERGAKSPSAASLLALARALELTPAQLLARAEGTHEAGGEGAPVSAPGTDHPTPGPSSLADLTTLVRELVRDELATSGATAADKQPGDVALSVPELRQRALEVLQAIHGDDLIIDDEGDIPLPAGEVVVFVRALDDPLSLLVFAPVLVDVDATAALDDQLNEINAGVRFVRFCWVRRSVVADLELFADPFVPEHLEPACRAVGRAAEEFLGELRSLFGGESFLHEPTPGPPPVAPRGNAGYL